MLLWDLNLSLVGATYPKCGFVSMHSDCSWRTVPKQQGSYYGELGSLCDLRPSVLRMEYDDEHL